MEEGMDNLYPGLDTSATWELLQNLLIEPGAWLPGAGGQSWQLRKSYIPKNFCKSLALTMR